jgi:eukaryotic-like serine/threonine-protein kinase
MTPSAGSVVAGRFKLVRELGSGSMGTVWLADHQTLDLRCAVKFMTTEASRAPNYRGRFELEARAIAQLHSPNVVRILDYDVHEGMPFIAMEFLQGEDLAARLERVGKLDPATTYRIISQVARGLSKAHEAGIVHRDLKPENIFLTEEDDSEVAKLLDFGIAKLAAFALSEGFADHTQAGSLLGTPAYMSPEQARGLADIDHRSDLWSLGVITYQCLTGRLPFESPTLGDLFAQIMFDPIPVPSKVDRSLPPDFDWWWARATLRNTDGRFGSARELADALGHALGVVHSSVEGHDVRGTGDGVVRLLAVAPRAQRPKVLVACLAAAILVIAALFSTARVESRMASAGGVATKAEAVRPAAAVPAPEAPVVEVVREAPTTTASAVFVPQPSARREEPIAPGRNRRASPVPAVLSPMAPSSAHPQAPRTQPTDDVDFGI